jgi:hydrogenase-1 operon protein HyaF
MICQTHSNMNGGMAIALLNEIQDLLSDFIEQGKEGLIDLRGLPMLDADRQQLEERLGRGEVTALIDVAGETEIWETAFSGVWWLRHKGSDGRVVQEQVFVGSVPDLLKSHKDDMEAALSRLKDAAFRE